MKVIFDTNIFIYHADGWLDAIDLLNKHKRDTLLMPSIVVAELLGNPLCNHTPARQIFEDYISTSNHIVPSGKEIAELAGEIRRTLFLQRNQKKLGTPDAMIAATAILTGAKLYSRNFRDFRAIKDHFNDLDWENPIQTTERRTNTHQK